MQYVEKLLATRWGQRSGSVLWIAILCLVLGIVLSDPDYRSVVSVYRGGSARFMAGEPLYNLSSAMGYLYAPAFAVIYAPFYWLGDYLGDALWRIAGFSVLTLAAIRQVRLARDPLPLWMLSMGLFLATPLAVPALRNGQATILISGACWFLIMYALERRWLRTTLFVFLSIVTKPTAVVAVLLVGAVRPRTAVPAAAAAVALFLALPFAFAPATYVGDMTRDFLALLRVSVSVEFTPADFTAPFTAIGIVVPPTVATGVRLIAAAATLLAVLLFWRRAKPRAAALGIMVMASYYMCLFNPRTEPNTYALLAVPFGLSVSLMMRREGLRGMPLILGALLLLSGSSGMQEDYHLLTREWLQPVLCTLVFGGIMRWMWKHETLPLSVQREPSRAYGQA